MIKIKRSSVFMGGKGEGPTAKWKEIKRVLPSDTDGFEDDVY